MRKWRLKLYWKRLVGTGGCIALISAYIGVYSNFLTSHESQMNSALLQQTSLMNMASSANPSAFVSAMQEFGPVQTIAVYKEPPFFEPWNWRKTMQPNIEPLLAWAKGRLRECESRECSNSNVYRIDLHSANLQRAILKDVALFESDLRDANLREANLTRADLYDSNMGDADIQEANLEEADLGKADLRGAVLRGADLTKAYLQEAELAEADLRGATGLTCKQLQKAEDWHLACRDTALACGADIPANVCESAERRFPLD